MNRGSRILTLVAAACASAFLWAEAAPSSTRLMDFRIAFDAGVFLYPQEVDGGYYIGGHPYDLNWYALQAGLTGIIEAKIPPVSRFGVGVAGSVFYSFNPMAMDDSRQVSVHTSVVPFGAFGGASVSYAFSESLRLNAILGYGGTGAESYYGGTGPAFSVAAHRVFPRSSVFGGLGVRYLFMALRDDGAESVSSESGTYMALLLEATLDWTP